MEEQEFTPGLLKLAVLIDADNVPYGSIKGIMEEITKDGIPTIKRIYGDWTKPAMKGWKESLLEYSITPIQQYAWTTGKNATDSALIIDAMDILHREHVEGFCIVSSDSDFTRLASRLRESGKMVIGIGEKKTPKPFITSCNKFIYIEILQKESAVTEDNDSKTPGQTAAAPAKKSGKQADSLLKMDEEIKSLLRSAVDRVSDDAGWANLGDIGNSLRVVKSDFDSRNYGFSKLSGMFKSLNALFETEERPHSSKKKSKAIYVRNKPQ
ncbi:NYN domain-containing protein [Dysgonomonas sp. GY75]|uniref:NYN domain-containing protein n=1 Tax=Dysgonomonas sp. GY75 TaxID=2780419 RepID=UPI001883C5CF|nr:NYN domain-containing protein [Dysgonomonas sp. GY75]MBF0649243.1 NYN domain-containing protein [Dysgonomonas sp. GY75]